jgi:hypothetical protein
MRSAPRERTRRGLVGLTVLVLAVVLLTAPALAQEPAVPLAVQAQLVAKVAAYDRNLLPRAPGAIHILLIARGDDDLSVRAAAQVKSALGDIPTIAGVAHDEEIVAWRPVEQLVQLVRDRKAGVVFVMPGLDEQLPALGKALDGVDVLSVGASGDSARRGMVLAFDLVSGRPTITVNMTQARRQNVALKPELLKLAKVVE